MTTRDKGITFPSFSDYVNFTGSKIQISFVPKDFANKNSWDYSYSSISPSIAAPTDASAPVDFTLKGQNATSALTAAGGEVNLTPGAGSNGSASGNINIQDTNGLGGGWNTSHVVLGTYHLWLDAKNRLRVKGSVPTSDQDGSVVGIDLSGTATYDPPSLADGAGATTTVTVAGALLGDLVLVSFSRDLTGILLTGYISANGVASVRFQNESGGTIDLASGTLTVKVIKQ